MDQGRRCDKGGKEEPGARLVGRAVLAWPGLQKGEILPSWMNLTSYPTGTGACWKPIPTGVGKNVI